MTDPDAIGGPRTHVLGSRRTIASPLSRIGRWVRDNDLLILFAGLMGSLFAIALTIAIGCKQDPFNGGVCHFR